jgi:hypothetical protein
MKFPSFPAWSFPACLGLRQDRADPAGTAATPGPTTAPALSPTPVRSAVRQAGDAGSPRRNADLPRPKKVRWAATPSQPVQEGGGASSLPAGTDASSGPDASGDKPLSPSGSGRMEGGPQDAGSSGHGPVSPAAVVDPRELFASLSSGGSLVGRSDPSGRSGRSRLSLSRSESQSEGSQLSDAQVQADPESLALYGDIRDLAGQVAQLRSILPREPEVPHLWADLANELAESEARLATWRAELMSRADPSPAADARWPSAQALVQHLRVKVEQKAMFVARVEKGLSDKAEDKLRGNIHQTGKSIAGALIPDRPGSDQAGLQRMGRLHRLEAEERDLYKQLRTLLRDQAYLPDAREELAELRQRLAVARLCADDAAAVDYLPGHESAPASPAGSGRLSIDTPPPEHQPSSPVRTPSSPVAEASTSAAGTLAGPSTPAVPEPTPYDVFHRAQRADSIEAALPKGGAALRRLKERAARQRPATALQRLRTIAQKPPRALEGRRELAFQALVQQDVQALATAQGISLRRAAGRMLEALEDGTLGRGILDEDRQVLRRMLEQMRLGDPLAGQRVPAPPVPPEAPYRLNVALLQQYAGEQHGHVWGTPVTYLQDEAQRAPYRLYVQDGKLYDAQGELFDTRGAGSAFGGTPGRAIFVMDAMGSFYASNVHAPGKFQHSSFLAGGPVAAAGEMEVHNGKLRLVTKRCETYRPTWAQVRQAVHRLESLGVPASWNEAELLNQLATLLRRLAPGPGPGAPAVLDTDALRSMQQDRTAGEIGALRAALAFAKEHPGHDFSALLPPGVSLTGEEVHRHLQAVAASLEATPAH